MKAQSRSPLHPGILLRDEVLPALGLTVTAAAKALGLSRQTLHRILAGEAPVTPPVAVRLGQLAGNGGELWAVMQARHDVWKLEQTMKAVEKLSPRENS